jgi:hypothetical protein
LFYFIDFAKIVPDILHIFLRVTEKMVWCVNQLAVEHDNVVYVDKTLDLLKDILKRPSFKFTVDTTSKRINRPNFDGDDVFKYVLFCLVIQPKIILELWRK